MTDPEEKPPEEKNGDPLRLPPKDEKKRLAATRSPIDRAAASSDPRLRKRPRPKQSPVEQARAQCRVPIDASPETIVGASSACGRARSALKQVHGAWTAVADAAHDRNIPADRLADLAERAVAKALRAADQATAAIDSNLEHLRKQAATKIMPKVDAQLASEIRSHWRGRKPDDFGALVAAVSSDATTSSAVLSAPGYLARVNDEQRELLYDAAVAGLAPELRTAIDDTERAGAKVAAVGGRMLQDLSERIRIWRGPASNAEKTLEQLAG